MRPDLARALASAFLAGEWDRTALVGRGRVVISHSVRWLPGFVERVLAAYQRPPADRPRELAAYLQTLAIPRKAERTRPRAHLAAPTSMVRNPWRLPQLDSVADLAAMLELSVPQLLWFADVKGLERSAPDEPLRHYRVAHLPSASGGVRVLEVPKPRLRHLQRRLLTEVLHLVPLHDAAHGFRPGRSIGGYAAPHAGKAIVIRLVGRGGADQAARLIHRLRPSLDAGLPGHSQNPDAFDVSVLALGQSERFAGQRGPGRRDREGVGLPDPPALLPFGRSTSTTSTPWACSARVRPAP